MYKELPGLVMFSNLGEDSIIENLSQIIKEFDGGDYDKRALIGRINKEIHKLLEIGTDYGFDKNLWHDYIAYVIATNENPFSLTFERTPDTDGSVSKFVLEDMRIFNHLFNYDFNRIEKSLGISCFSTITNYTSIHKRNQLFNSSVSEKVRWLSDEIESGLRKAEEEYGAEVGVEKDDAGAKLTMDTVVSFYRTYGVGMFGLNTAFRLAEDDSEVNFNPINNTEKVMLDDLVGYEIQKKRLRENTEAFLLGKPANNVLLFGDAGTGKSTSIKALINEYQDRGLRMIELYKHQMGSLSKIISSVKYRNYRFIIYRCYWS